MGLNPRCAPNLPDPPARPGSPPRLGTRPVDHHVCFGESNRLGICVELLGSSTGARGRNSNYYVLVNVIILIIESCMIGPV